MVCRIAFQNKLKQHKCIKIAFGSLKAWASYGKQRPMTEEELEASRHKSMTDFEIYMLEHFGVHSEAMESQIGYLLVNLVFRPAGHTFVAVGGVITKYTDLYYYEHSYSYQSKRYSNKYTGMYAIAKRKIKFTKNSKNKFLLDNSMPEYNEIEVFGGILDE